MVLTRSPFGPVDQSAPADEDAGVAVVDQVVLAAAFQWAADSGNPLYGAGAFVLWSLGNIAIVAVLFLLVIR